MNNPPEGSTSNMNWQKKKKSEPKDRLVEIIKSEGQKKIWRKRWIESSETCETVIKYLSFIPLQSWKRKREKKKGRKDIQRNNDPNLPKFDENINQHIKD